MPRTLLGKEHELGGCIDRAHQVNQIRSLCPLADLNLETPFWEALLGFKEVLLAVLYSLGKLLDCCL